MCSTKKAIAFIDGFNLYHSLDGTPSLRKYKWLDLNALATHFLTKAETLSEVRYFTAYTEWDQSKKKRHAAYVQALLSTNVKVAFGQFIEKTKMSRVRCHNACGSALSGNKCGKMFITHEEKKTDVNIAVSIISACVKDECDAVYLLSGDNDLIPALLTGHNLFPHKDFRVILPINSKAGALKRACYESNFKHHSIKEPHLSKAQFPNVVTFNNKTFTRPPTWR